MPDYIIIKNFISKGCIKRIYILIQPYILNPDNYVFYKNIKLLQVWSAVIDSYSDLFFRAIV